MTGDNKSLELFGRLVTERLRDDAMEFFEHLAAGKWRSPGVQKLQRELTAMSKQQREVVGRCVLASIDNAIHDFLFTIQEGEYRDTPIQFLVGGQDVTDQHDGIYTEPSAEGSWNVRFSKYGDPEEHEQIG